MTVFEFHLTYMINICSTFLEQTYMDLVQKKNGCPYHSWYGSTFTHLSFSGSSTNFAF